MGDDAGVVPIERVHAIAARLPEVEETPHHGMRSFRVHGKIVATIPDERHLRVMVGESEILAAVEADPRSCAPFFWGKRLACVVITLRTAEEQMVRELLLDAWSRKAPARLVEQFDADAWLLSGSV